MIKIRNANGEVIAVPGLKGRAGKSAYDYAVEGGYQGTEQEFKDFLKNTTSIMSDHKVDPEAHLDIRTEVSDLKDKVDNISISGGDASEQIEEHNTSSTAHDDIRELIAQLETELDNIPIPDVSDQINTHNTSNTAHDDIRQLINNLTTRLNALADSDDETLDQLSEIVAYIKSNKTLIESVTTTKVNVDDIIDNLISTAADKPLSANQGRVLNEKIEEFESQSVVAKYDEENTILELELNVPVQGIIEDSLNSTNTYNALSANQGKVLNDKINEVNTNLTSLTNIVPHISMYHIIMDSDSLALDIPGILEKKNITSYTAEQVMAIIPLGGRKSGDGTIYPAMFDGTYLRCLAVEGVAVYFYILHRA